jgi:hypothetical protein
MLDETLPAYPTNVSLSSKDAWLSPGRQLTDVMGDRRGVRGRAEMAIADDLVQLLVGQLEEPLRFTVAIVSQTGCAEDRILEGDRDRRTVGTHGRARDIQLRRCHLV